MTIVRLCARFSDCERLARYLDIYCCQPCAHGEGHASECLAPVPSLPEPVELEALASGLTPRQEIRARALEQAMLAVNEALPIEGDLTADAVVEQTAFHTLKLARQFAAWVEHGDAEEQA